MDRNKSLVLYTLAASLLVFSMASVYQTMYTKPAPIVLNTNGFLSVGKPSAPVEVVLIEDFRCTNCLKFSRTIMPKIQSEYIKKGTVKFVLVPVSFLAGSQAVANAALEVYKQNPERFFAFFEAILHEEKELKIAELVRIAKRIGGIDLIKLHQCIEKGCHEKELDQNLAWARNIMGLNFRTPAIYINGSPGSTFSYEAIQYQIKETLSKKP